MKSTYNIPDDLLDSVSTLYPGMTKTAIIITGLNLAKTQKHWENFKKLKGKVKINIDLDTLRDRSHHKWHLPHAA